MEIGMSSLFKYIRMFIELTEKGGEREVGNPLTASQVVEGSCFVTTFDMSWFTFTDLGVAHEYLRCCLSL